MAGYAKSLIEKWTALYVRLSRDDDNEGDSNSISHQVEILTTAFQGLTSTAPAFRK